MGFWIFMQIMCLLIPAVMILFGKMFLKSAPKDINFVFGYRTAMSMKNRDTWDFAHKHCGKLWVRLGLILIPVSIIPMIFVFGKNKDVIGGLGCIISLVETAVLIISIFPTEKALKENFDENGNRINK